jgi:hypothetical protein
MAMAPHLPETASRSNPQQPTEKSKQQMHRKAGMPQRRVKETTDPVWQKIKRQGLGLHVKMMKAKKSTAQNKQGKHGGLTHHGSFAGIAKSLVKVHEWLERHGWIQGCAIKSMGESGIKGSVTSLGI